MEMFEDETGGPPTGKLPIVGYNHLAGRTAEAYFPSLSREELVDVLRYEQTHRDRLPIIRSLTAHLRRLRRGKQDGPPADGHGPLPA